MMTHKVPAVRILPAAVFYAHFSVPACKAPVNSSISHSPRNNEKPVDTIKSPVFPF